MCFLLPPSREQMFNFNHKSCVCFTKVSRGLATGDVFETAVAKKHHLKRTGACGFTLFLTKKNSKSGLESNQKLESK